MKISILLGCLLVLAGLSPGRGADVSGWRPPAARAPVHVLRVPPRSPEASMVWASDACWRGCERQCGWRFQACLKIDGQGECMAQANACDRSCQSGCRTYGGPLLNGIN
jgi:hypothetical protein